MIILPDAQADLQNAKEWYERQRGGLGAAFILAVEEALERFSRNPEMHPIVHQSVRRAIIRQFPYAVYYLIEADEIIVLGVFHASRYPHEWQSRA